MRTVLFLLVLFPNFFLASVRTELTGNVDFLQSEYQTPTSGEESGMSPYLGWCLRCVWPSGFKFGIKCLNPFRGSLNLEPLFEGSPGIPAEYLNDFPPEWQSLLCQEIDVRFDVPLPHVGLFEFTLPVTNLSGPFSLGASFGIGGALWAGPLVKATTTSRTNDLFGSVGIRQTTFSWSALLNAAWQLPCRRLVFSAYGGYISLGEVDLSLFQGLFKSRVGGLTFGFGFGLKI